jgi:transcriptional regulator with XRE-family HTH domain
LPERLKEAFERAGYWKKGRPDVLRFSLDKRFLPQYLYKYLAGDAVPDRENLFRIADWLGVSPAWLLFGDEKKRRS